MEFKPGGEYTVQARALDINGAGVCAIDGFVVFARGLMPGETARVRLCDVRSSYAKAETAELLEASPDRREPACGLYGLCGGCGLMHMSYARELEFKRQLVKDALGRIAGFKDIYVEPVVGGWNPQNTDFSPRYRNKGQYAFDTGRCASGFQQRGEKGRCAFDTGQCAFGFRREGSHEFVGVCDCMLQKSGNAAILRMLSEWAGCSRACCHGLRDAVIRTGEYTGETMLILNYTSGTDTGGVDAAAKRAGGAHTAAMRAGGANEADGFAGGKTPGGMVPAAFRELAEQLRRHAPGFRSLVVNSAESARRMPRKRSVTVYGDGAIDEKLDGMTFRVSNEAFFQVNTRMAEVLYKQIAGLACLKSGDFALDLYCGTGTISAFLARDAGWVTAVDTSEDAIRDARENAARNGLKNLSFIKARAEQAIESAALPIDLAACAPAGSLDTESHGSIGAESHGNLAAAQLGCIATASSGSRASAAASVSLASAAASVSLASATAPPGSRIPDLVVLDPPRRGCDARLIAAIKELRVKKLIYVSCDPATLCRDAALLCSGDGAYAIEAVRPLDMFARTANVETVALFTLRQLRTRRAT